MRFTFTATGLLINGVEHPATKGIKATKKDVAHHIKLMLGMF